LGHRIERTACFGWRSERKLESEAVRVKIPVLKEERRGKVERRKLT